MFNSTIRIWRSNSRLTITHSLGWVSFMSQRANVLGGWRGCRSKTWWWLTGSQTLHKNADALSQLQCGHDSHGATTTTTTTTTTTEIALQLPGLHVSDNFCQMQLADLVLVSLLLGKVTSPGPRTRMSQIPSSILLHRRWGGTFGAWFWVCRVYTIKWYCYWYSTRDRNNLRRPWLYFNLFCLCFALWPTTSKILTIGNNQLQSTFVSSLSCNLIQPFSVVRVAIHFSYILGGYCLMRKCWVRLATCLEKV